MSGRILATGYPEHLPQGGQVQARGLLDFSGTLPTNKVAITGGTGDYIRAGGEIELKTLDPGPPRSRSTRSESRPYEGRLISWD